MTITTKARVRVVLEIDGGDDAWSDEEKGLGRAFKYSRERALNTLNRVFAGEPLGGERDKIRLVKVESVELDVKVRES